MYPTIDNDLYHSCDWGFFKEKNSIRIQLMYIRLSTCQKKWNENYDILFGQFRGASFTSFFNTYNLTKY